MEKALIFIHNFIKQDFSVRAEQWTEANDQLFQSHLAALNSHYSGNIRSNIYRQDPVPSEKLAEGKKYLETLQQKKLFQVREYKHPVYEKVYSAYVSSDSKGDNDYFIKLYFTLINTVYKIVSIYYVCTDCEGTGQINHKPCSECQGAGWVWQGGVQMNSKEKPLAIKRFLKPANPAHLKEYEQEQ